jgi:hypothetical protein
MLIGLGIFTTMHEDLSEPQGMNHRIEQVRGMRVDKIGIVLPTISQNFEITSHNKRHKQTMKKGGKFS